MSKRMDLRPAVALFVILIAGGLSPACAQGTAPVPAEQDGPLGALARQTGLRSKVVDPADFVRESRPSEMNFIPVHSKRPDAPGKLLTTDELKARELELDSLKASHDLVAKRPRNDAVYKPLQAPAPPKVAPPKPVNEVAPVKVEVPTLR